MGRRDRCSWVLLHARRTVAEDERVVRRPADLNVVAGDEPPAGLGVTGRSAAHHPGCGPGTGRSSRDRRPARSGPRWRRGSPVPGRRSRSTPGGSRSRAARRSTAGRPRRPGRRRPPSSRTDAIEPVDRFDGAREQVRRADEVGHEPGRRTVVELLGQAELLDLALVHDRDPVAHRERLLLIVGHVDERDPDLDLDPLELELEALAELEVERAERLVEQEDLGPVDERPGERDALLLAARQLVRLAPAEVGRGGRARAPRRRAALTSGSLTLWRRSPNAMLSWTLRCGNRA